jgi:hypothetical protein
MAKKRKDWIPQNHEELYNRAAQTVAYLTDDVLTRIGIAGAALVWYRSVFRVKYDSFKAAFANWQNPAERTPVKSTVLKETEEEFVSVYRKLYSGYIRENPLVTDDDLQSGGFPKRRAAGNRPPKIPVTLILMRFDTSTPATVIVHYFDALIRGTAKPAYVHGAEFRWAILDAPPVDWSELTHSVFDLRTPLMLTFTGEQRGKMLYIAARWENTRGEKGPWNNIEWVIIP